MKYALVLLVACHSPLLAPLDPNGLPPRADDDIPPPSIVVVATDVDARACLRLAEFGCPEAMSGCLTAFSRARTDGVQVPSRCIAAANSTDEVRACGDVSTMRVVCKGH